MTEDDHSPSEEENDTPFITSSLGNTSNTTTTPSIIPSISLDVLYVLSILLYPSLCPSFLALVLEKSLELSHLYLLC